MAEKATPAGKLDAIVADIKERWDGLRIGDGHFTGMMRKGFKEAGAGLLPAFPQQVGVIEEIGVFGNLSQGEIAQGRGDTGLDAEQEQKSVLGYELQQPPPEQGRSQDRGRGR